MEDQSCLGSDSLREAPEMGDLVHMIYKGSTLEIHIPLRSRLGQWTMLSEDKGSLCHSVFSFCSPRVGRGTMRHSPWVSLCTAMLICQHWSGGAEVGHKSSPLQQLEDGGSSWEGPWWGTLTASSVIFTATAKQKRQPWWTPLAEAFFGNSQLSQAGF